MALFFISFVFIAFVTFGAIAFFLRPTPDQKALYRRVTGIKTMRSELGVVVDVDQFLKSKQEGSFGWVEDLLEQSDVARKIQMYILQANSKTSVGTVLISMAGLGLATLLIAYLFTSSVIIAPIAALALGYVPLGLLKFRVSRRVKSFDSALGDSVDMMARSLRAGHSLPAAISIVAEQAREPVRAEFSEVFKQQNYGLPMRDALMQMLQRVPSQDLRVVVTGMLVQKDTGGNLAEILDRIVHVIRERVRIQREIRTHTAQGRMTGWILCLLPVVMLLFINMMNPGYSKVLFEEGPGRTILYIGISLLLVGGFIIRKIINGIEV